MTTTGYGEELVKNAFRCDYGLVETVAHFTAAKYFMPDVDFIIDIGGQDMKCFKIEDGAISNIFLNEAFWPVRPPSPATPPVSRPSSATATSRP